MTSRRSALGSLALVAALVAALLPRAAAASKADAFEGKIQPVSGKLFSKGGRLEVTLGGDLSLNDAFFQKRFADLKVGWNFTDAWGLSLHGAVGTAVPTSSTNVCPINQGCHPATEAQLFQVPGRIRSLAGAEAEWTPIYGKLNAFSEQVGHIDLSVLAGADYIVHDEILSRADAGAGATPGQLRTLGFHVGLGLRLYLAEAFALRIDLKDYVYGVRVPNVDGGAGTDIQNQIFAEVGLSVFFPFSNRRQP
jgi:outer membrane beta-barrel protein